MSGRAILISLYFLPMLLLNLIDAKNIHHLRSGIENAMLLQAGGGARQRRSTDKCETKLQI
jgi:hypothetical protein